MNSDVGARELLNTCCKCSTSGLTWSKAAVRLVAGLVLLVGSLTSHTAGAQSAGGTQIDPTSLLGGPIRLMQPANPDATPAGVNGSGRSSARGRQAADGKDKTGVDGRTRDGDQEGFVAPYQPSEFELFVRQLAGQNTIRRVDEIQQEDDPKLIRRFGAELITGAAWTNLPEGSALVPDDYLLGPGDEVALNIWGGVDANLRLKVDRSGRISIPRVGTVSLVGVKYADLRELISQRVALQFRNFQLSVALAQLRGVRVYVTGFVQRPGAYTVSSVSTVLQALLAAGGPSAVGSMRDIQLRRTGSGASHLDLYDLLLRGDRSGDRVLRDEDVIHVAAVGAQVGVIGSVNKPAVFELRNGDSVGEVLKMAGGFSAIADRSRVAVHRLNENSGARIRELPLPQSAGQSLSHGDVLRVFSAVEVAQPGLRQNKRVRVEGEVLRPGDYVLPAGSSLQDAIQAAGGLTPEAFLFGTEFNRESVRLAQQESYERKLLDLETEFKKSGNGPKIDDRPEDKNMRVLEQYKLIERLRAVKPSGRVVLQFAAKDSELPALMLEDGDRVYVPAKPTTVSVYGSVFNAGSYLFTPGRELDEYLRQSGGPTKGADKSSVFVVRANGEVISSRERKGGWFSGGDIGGLQAMAGDTIVVPEEFQRTASMQEAKDWAQILYQFAVGVATVKAIK
jgi:protein involved in polysaccharide export with SLBB domain